MKKSLLAVALLGTFGAALADTNVTVYGTVDAGVSYNSGSNANGSVTSLASGQQSYSRFGLRGTEDLGSGLKALFVLEGGFQLDKGTSGLSNPQNNIAGSDNAALFGSQAYLGLAGNFGTVKAGRQFSPLYDVYGTIDPFANGFAANINNFYGTDEFGLSNYQRMSSALSYSTPDNAYGVKGTVAYGFGGVSGSISEKSQIGASLSYVNGPLTLAYAYHQSKNDSIAFPGTFKTNFIGAKYDFGVAAVHGAIDQNQRADTLKTQDYMIGVSAPFGPFSVFADYTHKRNKLFSGGNANQYAVGGTYALSKRTNAYAAVNYVRNGDFSFVDTDTGGQSVKAVQVGLRHSF